MLLIILIVDLFLWFLSLLPPVRVQPMFAEASGWLAFIAAVILAVIVHGVHL